MKNQSYYALLSIVVAVYSSASKVLFDNVYAASQVIVDELYHLPQGLAYCENNFTRWDPKITTLPGLYLVSASFVSTFLECSTYYLRSVNLVASVVNLCLFASILKFVYGHRGDGIITIVLQALNFALLPPLYFFSHVYYTDTLSLTFILALFRLCLENEHKIAIAGLGAFSIMMRQTNVVWIALILGHKLLDLFIKSSRVYGNSSLNKPLLSPLNKNVNYMRTVDQSKLKKYYDISDLFIAVRFHVSNYFIVFIKPLLRDWKLIAAHGSILSLFVLFIIVNGSIVVGDRTAHVASLHLPQVLYFLLFYGVFGLPHVLASFLPTLRLMLKNKVIILLLSLIFLIVVEYNTIIHPYLLADNRHFTFYVWQRWFAKFWFAKYATIPAYVFLAFSLYTNLKEQNCISFLLPYSVCAFASMGLQQMIEVRYFIIPFLILRMRFSRPALSVVLFESLWYLLLNIAAYYVFFNKTFVWKDFEGHQRIIW